MIIQLDCPTCGQVSFVQDWEPCPVCRETERRRIRVSRIRQARAITQMQDRLRGRKAFGTA